VFSGIATKENLKNSRRMTDFLCIESLLVCLDSQGPTMVFLLMYIWRHDSFCVSSISRSRDWAIKLPEQFLSVSAFVTDFDWYRLLLLFGLISAEYYSCCHV